MEADSVATAAGFVALVAAVLRVGKSIFGDVEEFSRRRLRRIDASVASIDPTRPIGRFAAALREEEAFRQLMGVAPAPRIAALTQALYETGEFTQRELVHAIRQLPYDANVINDKRNRGNAMADIVGGSIQSLLGLYLVWISVSMLDEVSGAADYVVLAGAAVAGLLMMFVYVGSAIRGKHSLDAITRVSEAVAPLERTQSASAAASSCGGSLSAIPPLVR